jgi:hypothetical protein
LAYAFGFASFSLLAGCSLIFSLKSN